jgi:hypothetical protein
MDILKDGDYSIDISRQPYVIPVSREEQTMLHLFAFRGRGLCLGVALCSCLILGCATKAGMPAAKVYPDPGLAKAGSYHLRFLLDGQGTLPEYLEKEKARNDDLRDFTVAGLLRLFRRAYPQLFLPVQPDVPLCHLETNFKHCRGIELLADLEIFTDETVVLHGAVYYHITLRLERDQPNFFRAAMAQRNRGEFALPRHYYVGALVEAIQKEMPILREIATDYRKYLKDDRQEIEIAFTIEDTREKVSAWKSEQNVADRAQLSSNVILSLLPSISFVAGLTVSSLTSGGRTFWDVLQEKEEFDLSKKHLALQDVEFSYTESAGRNFSRSFKELFDPPADMYIRDIKIRLRNKEPRSVARDRR